MNARLIARCTGPRPFDGACGFLRRFGWCGHFVMVCREFSTSAPLAMNTRLIARCTGPRPFDGACGFLRRFGWYGHFVMVLPMSSFAFGGRGRGTPVALCTREPQRYMYHLGSKTHLACLPRLYHSFLF